MNLSNFLSPNYYSSLFRGKIAYWVYTPLVRVLLWLKGIQLDKSVSFAGVPYFSRRKDSVVFVSGGTRFMSLQTGNTMGINHRCIVDVCGKNAKVIIGKNCGFSGVAIRCFDSITIGNNVKCGANVTITDGDSHPEDPRSGVNKPVVIEDNVWIGINVIILKGVTIGRNSFIGAGSVVTKDIPANVVAVGAPCRPVRMLTEDVIRKLEEQ